MTAARTTRPPKPAPTTNGTWTPPPHRFTVAEYHRLIDLGIVTTSHRVELIHGLIVGRPAINPPHATSLGKVTRRFLRMFEDSPHARIQVPITLPPDSEPQPDLVVARGTLADYGHRHPGPKDILLVVEVSDASLADDQTTKLALYAANKLPEYWVINIPERRVEVYTNPRGGKSPTYRTRTDYGPDDAVPVSLAGSPVGAIPARELLP